METRKVQITGRSTYVVSLPKTWVNKVKIKNGDSIGMVPRSDGTLLINPKLTERGEKTDEQLTKKINIDSQNMDEFTREFIGVYLAGHNIIEMNFKHPVSKNIRQKIRELSHDVIGPEIIDESVNSVTVKDLLDASDFSIVKGVKRMYIITKAMYTDALNALNNKDKDLAEDVESRDNDVDKLHWLISKQFNLILKDVFFADKMGVKPQEALSFLLTARAIERIADHAARLAKNSKIITEKTPLDEKIIEISNKALEVFDGSIASLYRRDLKNAHDTVEKSKKIHTEIEKLRQDILSLKKTDIPTIVSLTYIVDSLDRTRGYAEDIAEIAINHYFVA
jgi:phosphate uptake regulator